MMDGEVKLANLLEGLFQDTLNEIPLERTWMVRKESSFEQVMGQHCVVVTIASFRYRVMCLLHVDLCSKTHEIFKELLDGSPQTCTVFQLTDYFLEMGNSMTGAVKRSLQCLGEAQGMSTPNIITGDSLYFSEEFGAKHGVHVVASDQFNDVKIGASILLCEDEGEFDFELLSDRHASEASGALEMF